jgi:hypothetical protein
VGQVDGDGVTAKVEAAGGEVLDHVGVGLPGGGGEDRATEVVAGQVLITVVVVDQVDVFEHGHNSHAITPVAGAGRP